MNSEINCNYNDITNFFSNGSNSCSKNNHVKPFQVGLIRIIIHTLAAHAHVCDRYSKPYSGFAARSRDMSQLSLEEEDGQNLQTNGNQIPQAEMHQDEEEGVETPELGNTNDILDAS